MRLRTFTALAAAAASLAAAPAALAHTRKIGNASGTPSMNVCVLGFNCTYINAQSGKPSDVVRHTGTITSWSLNAGSQGGRVRLRALRPIAGGKFKAIRSSVLRTVLTTGLNTFPAHLGVRKGDVLALGNDSSGIYMAQSTPGTSIKYFSNPFGDGSTGAPDRTATQLHVLLSAQLHY